MTGCFSVLFVLFVCLFVCLYTQKKFLRVRLASDDEEGEEVKGSQGTGGEELQDTQQTKEMEEVKIGTNGRFSFIGLCACNLGIGNM